MKKKDKENLEFIKSKFNQTYNNVPEKIKADNISQLINDSEQKKIRIRPSKSVKAAISLAACFAIILTALTIAKPYYINDIKTVKPVTDEADSADGLSVFSSRKEITDTVDKIIKEQNKSYGMSELFSYSSDILKSTDEAIDTETSSEGTVSVDESSYGETYTQLEEVDEADIIKNNGKYIFWYDSSSNAEIKIYEGKKLVGTIDEFKHGENQSDEYVYEMYLHNNKLIVNVEDYVYKKANNSYTSYTKCCIFDISDVENPKLESTFSQSGYYQSSRMIDDTLYLITTHCVTDNRIKSNIVPSIAYNDGESKELEADCICYPENPSNSTFIVISAIDTKTGNQSTKSKAFLGFSDNIYCNTKNLYITANCYGYSYIRNSFWYDGRETYSDDYNYNKVKIVKVALEKDSIEFTATGDVKGNINDQFSLDEKDGYLRVATTSTNDNAEQENNLFVLDENLKLKGKITGFANNESIKAVRYIGDMAYVITYKDVDPLFVIDLSNPEKPEIKGSVKISGFSSLLVPVDERTLLGIGYATKEGASGEYTNGIKLALFDIANPEKPTVLDSYALYEANSEAQYNHHALMVNKSESYYAIPIETYNYEQGVLTFKIEDNEIKTSAYLSHNRTGYCPRCTYIDDSIYLFKCASDNVDEFKINPNEIGK